MGETAAGQERSDERVLAGEDRIEAFVRAAAGEPRAAALFCDIDGTVSPIVARPQDAVVPDPTRALLRELVARLGLVAFVTGRALEDGRAMVDLPGAAYVGLHGLEALGPDGRRWTEPEARRFTPAVRTIVRLARERLDTASLGIVLEDKHAILALHYRLARDPDKARAAIEHDVLPAARERGLAVTTGHFLYEVCPPVASSKGTATRHLLGGAAYATAAFLGDDLTDISGFDALRSWADAGESPSPKTSLALAAVTAETPPDVLAASDAQVAATPGVVAVLRRLVTAVTPTGP
jgi:trehalose-phosphatase